VSACFVVTDSTGQKLAYVKPNRSPKTRRADWANLRSGLPIALITSSQSTQSASRNRPCCAART